MDDFIGLGSLIIKEIGVNQFVNSFGHTDLFFLGQYPFVSHFKPLVGVICRLVDLVGIGFLL